MHEGEIEGPETPIGHDLDEAPIADKLRLHDGRQLANAAARQQSCASPAKSFMATYGWKVSVSLSFPFL